MRSIVFLGMTLLTASMAIGQNHPSLPSSFRATTIHSKGADIFVRSGGRGPVVVLLHGYAENSDSWAPLAADLMKDHSVVVPDLRGIGRSSKPESGYDKKTQAKDIRAVVTGLGYDRTFVVAHDIGNMVAYAYAAMYPDKVERLVVMESPIPGIEPWNELEAECGTYTCGKLSYLSIPVFGSLTCNCMDMDLPRKGWSRAVSESILTAYGMTSQEIPASPTKPPETFSRRPMLSQEE